MHVVQLGLSQPIESVLPLKNGDQVRFSIRLSRPAYVRLMWADAEGRLQEYYPHDPEFGHRGAGPVHAVDCPEKADRSWRVIGTAGREAAILQVSGSPLPPTEMPNLRLGRRAVGDPYLLARYEATGNKRVTRMQSKQRRALSQQTLPSDDPLLELLERLRLGTDLVQAISIPHVEAEAVY